MSRLSLDSMRHFLGRSIASINRNKVRGLLAEVAFRRHLVDLGFGDRVSPGGWIARSEGEGMFGHRTVVFLPEVVAPGSDYPEERGAPTPSQAVHTICSKFHESGIHAFYCSATVQQENVPESLRWKSIQLGIPSEERFLPFPESLDREGFTLRPRNYNFLRYRTDSSVIPDDAVAEEFCKENLRVAFQTRFMSEISDVDGIFWGTQFTYPIEIKEKTVGRERKLGAYFGLDVGPFVKLAFYAAKRGNLKSLFVVREIDDPDRRDLVAWWYITFDELAQFASWGTRGGGTSMLGSASSVVQVPKAEFRPLTVEELSNL
jgi:hypothetical protein